MKVTQFDILRADAGWRIFSFLKVMTDEGLIGWSELNESFGSAGLADVIRELFKIVTGIPSQHIPYKGSGTGAPAVAGLCMALANNSLREAFMWVGALWTFAGLLCVLGLSKKKEAP